MFYTIKPLFFGTMYDLDKSTFTFRTDPGKKIEAPLLAYLVQNENQNILIDTGIGDDEIMDKKSHKPLRDRTSLRNALKKEGLTFSDIDVVIITHLHWDHSYNLEHFNHAPVYIQKKEIEYEMDPIPCDYIPAGISRDNGIPQWLAGFHNFHVIQGDKQILPGIKAVFLPGHTPGFQCVLVDTKKGKYLIGSDNYPLYENFTNMIPSGIHVDLREWYSSYRIAKEITDFILPGHDLKVLENKIYG